MSPDTTLGLDETSYSEVSGRKVVLANGCRTRDDYLWHAVVGRAHSLTRQTAAQIWQCSIARGLSSASAGCGSRRRAKSGAALSFVQRAQGPLASPQEWWWIGRKDLDVASFRLIVPGRVEQHAGPTCFISSAHPHQRIYWQPCGAQARCGCRDPWPLRSCASTTAHHRGNARLTATAVLQGLDYRRSRRRQRPRQ